MKPIGFLLVVTISVIPQTSFELLNQDISKTIVDFSEVICCMKPSRVFVYLENQTLVPQYQLIEMISKCNIPIYLKSSRTVINNNRRLEVHNEIAEALHLIEMNDITSYAVRSYLRVIPIKQLGMVKQKFLIYLNNQTEFRFNILDAIASRLWEKHKILNVIIISNNNEQDYIIQTYFPFTPNGMRIETLRNGDCNSLYPDKLDNLNRAELTSMMYKDIVRAMPIGNTSKYAGMDGFITEIFADQLNATIRIIPPTDGHTFGSKLDNGTVTGMWGDIFYERADFCLNTHFVSLHIHKGLIEYSITLERQDSRLLVPKAGEEPVIYNLFNTLSTATWIALIMMFVPVIGSFILLQNFQKFLQRKSNIPYHLRKHYSFKDAVVMIFQSFFGESLLEIPCLIHNKIFLTGWLVYSFLLTSSFSGKLISSLIFPKMEKDLDTLDDFFCKTNYTVIGPKPILTLYKSALSAEQGILIEKRYQIKEIPDLYQWFIKIENELNKEGPVFAFGLRPYLAKFSINYFYNRENERSYFHFMKEPLTPILSAYIFRPGSPYIEKFNELLLRMYVSGFVEYWENKYLYEGRIRGYISGSDDERNQHEKNKVLAFEHFESILTIWSIGMIISILVFVTKVVQKIIAK